MQGGGTKGAYEAGAIWGLIHEAADKSKYAYDVLTGISAGSVNGGAMAIFEPGDELNMVQVLSETWQELSTSRIFKLFDFVLIGGLTHSGMVNTSPLREYITNYFNKRGYEFKRKVAFGGVDSITGDFLVFNETLSNEDKINGVMTSAAIPFAFERIDWNWDGRTVNGIDGGVAMGLNIASAVHRCHEIVDDDSKITIDVLACGTKTLPPYEGADKRHTIHNWNRYNNIKSYNEKVSDVFELMQAFPKVNFRHYVGPSQTLPTMAIMDGTNSTCTYPMQLLGRKDGAHAIHHEGEIFKKFKEYNDSDDLKKKWPVVGDYVDHIMRQQARSDDEPIDIKCSISFLLDQ